MKRDQQPSLSLINQFIIAAQIQKPSHFPKYPIKLCIAQIALALAAVPASVMASPAARERDAKTLIARFDLTGHGVRTLYEYQ
jgi:hypothetical protein